MQINLRHNIKIAAFKVKAVGDQGVKMRVKTGIISKGLDSHNDTRDAMFLSHVHPEKLSQALCGIMAELAQQLPIVEEKLSQYLRNGKDVLAMGNRIENRFLEMVTKLNHLRNLRETC